MTKHTSTPWRGEMHGVLQDWPSIVDGKGALIVRTYGPNANADMRRIVACVNACAGISTEALVAVDDGRWTILDAVSGEKPPPHGEG